MRRRPESCAEAAGPAARWAAEAAAVTVAVAAAAAAGAGCAERHQKAEQNIFPLKQLRSSAEEISDPPPSRAGAQHAIPAAPARPPPRPNLKQQQYWKLLGLSRSRDTTEASEGQWRRYVAPGVESHVRCPLGPGRTSPRPSGPRPPAPWGSKAVAVLEPSGPPREGHLGEAFPSSYLSAPLPSSGPPRLAPPTLEARPAPARSSRVLRVPSFRACACVCARARGGLVRAFGNLVCSFRLRLPLLPGSRLSSLSRVLARLLVLSAPLLHLPLAICSPEMLCGGSARFLALAFISALLLPGGSGKSLEDGLGESKRTEVAKDLRFDQTGSLYARIGRFKRGSGKPSQNSMSGFDLSDALGPRTSTKQPPKKTGSSFAEFDLSDALDNRNDGFDGGRGRPDLKPGEGFDLSDALGPRTSTKQPPKKTGSSFAEFDLSDALDNRNDGFDGGRGRPDLKPGEGLTDKDLEGIIEGGYKPDKGKGDGRYDSNDDPGTGTLTETGTIASIASALAMALIGAISSYISYQQKKFCFNVQQGVNTDYAKGQSLEGVSTEEPQVKYSALQTQSTEKPSQETAKI
ncbi:CD99 antigen-like protein 2 [Sminthopsis crassicaudata]|uniref:CD99 antigen-like protein 2 n=1 Tax=Sminthopsis crassicaudata TaxID=9301 RepID=UPI003D693927